VAAHAGPPLAGGAGFPCAAAVLATVAERERIAAAAAVVPVRRMGKPPERSGVALEVRVIEPPR
jgi:hypothetical protein